MIISDFSPDLEPPGDAVLEGSGPELPALGALHVVLARHAETGDAGELQRGFSVARELLAGLPEFHTGGPARVDELRRLAGELPEFGELLDRAADATGEALARACVDIWGALGRISTVPGWSDAERDAARMAFACSCQPGVGDGSDWLPANLRRISAARLAALLCVELARGEAAWLRALGPSYGSLRHRCAPRTLLRSRGLAELLREDLECRAAVTARLERWLMAGAPLEALAGELEAAVVHARTPARLA